MNEGLWQGFIGNIFSILIYFKKSYLDYNLQKLKLNHHEKNICISIDFTFCIIM
jgi:hypothetical protein